VKALLEDWGYDSRYSFKPKTDGTKQSFAAVPYLLKKPDLVKLNYQIELGGLGKGYALDLMARRLQSFKNFCIDAGGDLYARGCPQKDRHWEIFFEHPTNLQLVMGKVEVDGFFVAASSPTKRKWAERYHHLADPITQKPADRMLAVYTQAQSGLLADAYSTALFVLGFQEAKKLLPGLPVEAMMVSPKGEIYRSPGFKGELFF
jgi:thiamine biosynthesis lipoprotein